MTNLDMYKIAENENIDILDYDWNKVKARIFELDNNYYIALNSHVINNDIEEKEILAEELGHYYCNALYYINSDKVTKRKCELRAMKWAYSILVPFQKLKEKIAQGFNLYDLADYFDVDINYMNDCITFYNNKYGILV